MFYKMPIPGNPIDIDIHIADIHFGVIDPNTQLQILMEQFIWKIQNIPFNTVYINGDLFDHKVMASSQTAKVALEFITTLANLCKMKNATLVILAGTASHDAGQLSLFYHLSSDQGLDVRIVEQTRFEYIGHKKVLCIPEEYDRGEDYYYHFLNQPYDMAILHGVFQGSIYGSNEADLDGSRPVFCMDHFYQCGGPIICGHVHKAGCFQQHAYYTGSPIRFSFGEEEPKGYLIILHDLNTNNYYTHFEEIKSFRYDTINLDHMMEGDPKDIIEYIKNLQLNGVDFVRIEFTKENANVMTLLKNYYRNNKTVKIKDETTQTVMQKKIQENNEQFDQYSYLFDNTLTEYDKLSQYINQQKGYDFISAEELKNILLDMI